MTFATLSGIRKDNTKGQDDFSTVHMRLLQPPFFFSKTRSGGA
jgi:hypothetical protein